jgi:hypothetical protein
MGGGFRGKGEGVARTEVECIIYEGMRIAGLPEG